MNCIEQDKLETYEHRFSREIHDKKCPTACTKCGNQHIEGEWSMCDNCRY